MTKLNSLIDLRQNAQFNIIRASGQLMSLRGSLDTVKNKDQSNNIKTLSSVIDDLKKIEDALIYGIDFQGIK